MSMVYYVYVLFRPTGAPFYIGKGKRGRWLDHEREGLRHKNKHVARIIAQAGGSVPKVKVREGLTNEEAIAIEIALICAIGRGQHGPLVNLTDGGEGVSGKVFTAEERQRVSLGHKGLIKSPETRRRLSETLTKIFSQPELRQAISVRQRGNKFAVGNRSNSGRKVSEETRQRMREARSRYWAARRAG